LGVSNRTQIVIADVFSLGEAQLASLPTAEVIFFDPPYPSVTQRPQDVQRVLRCFAEKLSDEGLLAFRHEKGAKLELPLPVHDVRTWGSMQVEFLGRPIP